MNSLLLVAGLFGLIAPRMGFAVLGWGAFLHLSGAL